MAKRGDYIHKRKDGRWDGRYPKGRNAKGAIKYASVYGKSYREVKEKLLTIDYKKRILLENIKLCRKFILALKCCLVKFFIYNIKF